MGEMLDTITPPDVPDDVAPDVVLMGYVDGDWPSYFDLVTRFPNNRVVSITVFGSDAEGCDCEKGDLSASEVVAWVQEMRTKGADPAVLFAYSSLDQTDPSHGWPVIRAAFQDADVDEPLYGIAMYPDVLPPNPVVPLDWAAAGVVFWQFAGSPGTSSVPGCDMSVTTADWPTAPTAAPTIEEDDMPVILSPATPAADQPTCFPSDPTVAERVMFQYDAIGITDNPDSVPLRLLLHVAGGDENAWQPPPVAGETSADTVAVAKGWNLIVPVPVGYDGLSALNLGTVNVSARGPLT